MGPTGSCTSLLLTVATHLENTVESLLNSKLPRGKLSEIVLLPEL